MSKYIKLKLVIKKLLYFYKTIICNQKKYMTGDKNEYIKYITYFRCTYTDDCKRKDFRSCGKNDK